MTTYVHIDIEALKELNDKLDDRVQQVRELRNELENMGEIERQLHVVEGWNTANQQVIVQRDAEIGGLMWENGRLRAEAESWREAFDTIVRVQAQETSMKITAQRALDDAQKRIAHLEAQDRATVNACNERHNVWGPRPPLGDLKTVRGGNGLGGGWIFTYQDYGTAGSVVLDHSSWEFVQCMFRQYDIAEAKLREAIGRRDIAIDKLEERMVFIDTWRGRCCDLERKLANEKRAYYATKAKFKLWRDRAQGFEWTCRLWEETCGSLSRKVGEAEDQLQRGRDYWHGRVEELMMANRSLSAKLADVEQQGPIAGLSRDKRTNVTTITWGSGDESRYVDEARFIEIAESREDVIAEVDGLKDRINSALGIIEEDRRTIERLQSNLNNRDRAPYRTLDDLNVQLEQSRKHLAASRKIRKRSAAEITQLRAENIAVKRTCEITTRNLVAALRDTKVLADWIYDELQRRDWGMIRRDVWDLVEEARTR